jgi:O-methyltransferase involved in polyketide biosynthesis
MNLLRRLRRIEAAARTRPERDFLRDPGWVLDALLHYLSDEEAERLITLLDSDLEAGVAAVVEALREPFRERDDLTGRFVSPEALVEAATDQADARA